MAMAMTMAITTNATTIHTMDTAMTMSITTNPMTTNATIGIPAGRCRGFGNA
jgi:hypothetical protein